MTTNLYAMLDHVQHIVNRHGKIPDVLAETKLRCLNTMSAPSPAGRVATNPGTYPQVLLRTRPSGRVRRRQSGLLGTLSALSTSGLIEEVASLSSRKSCLIINARVDILRETTTPTRTMNVTLIRHTSGATVEWSLRSIWSQSSPLRGNEYSRPRITAIAHGTRTGL